jgi:predicted CoA-binding protein
MESQAEQPVSAGYHIILGASINPARASYEAARMMDKARIPWVPVGRAQGELFGKPILSIDDNPVIEPVHTVTLYLGPANQIPYYEYLFSLHPKRIIFNPGTENPELLRLCRDQGIETVIACTLVMLSLGQYLQETN